VAVVVAGLALSAAAVVTRVDGILGAGLLLRGTGLAIGTTLAALLARFRVFRYLGARTLPIYLAHTPLIVVMAWAVHDLRGQSWVRDLVPVLPLVLTGIAVPLTLALYELVRRTPARVLYAPPQAITDTVYRAMDRVGRLPRHRLETPLAVRCRAFVGQLPSGYEPDRSTHQDRPSDAGSAGSSEPMARTSALLAGRPDSL
jgi:peptidoglycan/LPS O-acetylase OafA/YrhL